MSTELLLSAANDKLNMGVVFHRESADLFALLSLPGFAALHEYQMHSELSTQRRLKHYIISTCERSPSDKLPLNANLIEPLVKGRSRKEIVPNERWSITKKAFEAYAQWEASALKEYESVAQKLLSNGSVAAYEFVAGIAKDTSAELQYISGLIYAFAGTDWEMPLVTEWQIEMQELYEAKIKKLHKKYKSYHHHNSAECGKFC